MKSVSCLLLLGALLVSIIKDRGQRRDVRDSAAEAVPHNFADTLSGALISVARGGTSDAEQLIARVIEARAADLKLQKVAKALVAFAEAVDDMHHPYRLGVALERSRFAAPSLPVILDHLARSLGSRLAEGAQRQADKANRILSGFQVILLKTYIEGDEPLEAEQLWKWLRYLDESELGKREIFEELKSEFSKRPEIFRELQTRTLFDREFSDSVWMAVVHWVPDVLPFLQLSSEDARYHLNRIAAADNPDTQAWLDLVRGFGSDETVAEAIEQHRAEYPVLDEAYRSVALDQPHPAVEEHRRARAERQEARRKQREEDRKQRIEQFRGIKAEVKAGTHLAWLDQIAMARLGLFSDIEGETADERTVDLVGEEHLESAKSGLAAYLNKAELPTVAEIADLRRDQKRHRGEWIIAAAILLHVEEGGSLDEIRDRPCEIGALRYDEFPDVRQWTHIATNLRRRIFADQAWAENFLRAWFEPKLEAGEDLLAEQSWLEDEALDRELASRLAVDWLERFSQNLSENTAPPLFRLAAQYEDVDSLSTLIAKHMDNLDAEPEHMQRRWAALAFLCDFKTHRSQLKAKLRAKKRGVWLWAFRNLLGGDMRSRLSGKSGASLKPEQIVFLIECFGRHWPPKSPPEGGWMGDMNEWDATDFIGGLIADLAACVENEVGDHFQHLIGLSGLIPWHDVLRYQRERWMTQKWGNFRPGVAAAVEVMTEDVPQSPDDLKVTVLEALEELQQEVGRGDTKAWRKFWNNPDAEDPHPHSENDCRDRILEGIREKLKPLGIDLRAEPRMREGTRADIVATVWIGSEIVDLPIEVKGQWHKKLWTAAKEQLRRCYAEYNNARGHGIYLVLWCGADTAKHKCKRHPKKRRVPGGADELKAWLEDGMPSEIRTGIEVFVLDITRPHSCESKT